MTMLGTRTRRMTTHDVPPLDDTARRYEGLGSDEDAATSSATTVTTRSAFGAGQLLGLAVGVGSTVIGGVALAGTGLDFSDVASTHRQVAGMHHTSVLAAASLVFGLVAVGAAVLPGGVRSLFALLGLIALGSGVVVVADAPRLHNIFGTHTDNGWLFIGYGVALLLAAALPAYGRVARYRHVAG